MYINDVINFTPRDETCSMTPDIEVAAVTLQFDNCRNCLIITCYRPPSGNVEAFINSLSHIMDSYCDVAGRLDVIITGDFNIDLSAVSSQQRLLDEFAKTYELTQHITDPTRVTLRSSSILDHFYTKAVHIGLSGVCDIGLSDHHLIYLVKKKELIKIDKISIEGRDYKRLDFDILQTKLTSHNWGRFFALNCPITAWSYLSRIINEIIDDMCPVREFRILQSRPPWYSDEIISATRSWERLHRIARRTKDPGKKEEANNARNSLKSLITRTKKSYYQYYLDLFSNDSKKFWENINELTGSSKAGSVNVRIINPNTGLLCDTKETGYWPQSSFSD